MKKIFIFFVFIVFVFGVYYIKQFTDKDNGDFYYLDEFNELDKSNWYVGEWKTMFSAYEKAKLNSGILKLEIDEVDRGPFLLSKPIALENGQVLSVKRRVRLTHTSASFTGGFALVETNDKGVMPSALNEGVEFLGNGVVLVEYVFNSDESSTRPGNNTFRILPRMWTIGDNYALINPVFSKWFEEELVYDTNLQTVSYTIDGETVVLKSQEMKEDHIRLYMHGYGYGIGHAIEIDWVEITVK